MERYIRCRADARDAVEAFTVDGFARAVGVPLVGLLLFVILMEGASHGHGEAERVDYQAG